MNSIKKKELKTQKKCRVRVLVFEIEAIENLAGKQSVSIFYILNNGTFCLSKTVKIEQGFYKIFYIGFKNYMLLY